MTATSVPGALSGYCTATLLQRHELMVRDASGWSWPSQVTIEAGSKVLLASETPLAAYAFDGDGEVWKVLPANGKGLVADVEVSADCTLPPLASDGEQYTLLRDATFHDDVSGASCRLKAGMQLTEPRIAGGDQSTVRLTAPELETSCHIAQGSTSDAAFAKLIAR